MRPLRQALCAAALAAGSALASPGIDEAPAPGPARPLQWPAFVQQPLPNGLRVVVVQRRQQPLVTALLQVKAGSLLDPPGRTGLASLAFTVMGKGARRGGAHGRVRDAAALAEASEALGASLESGSGPQAGQFGMTVARDRIDEALALLADVTRRPTLPAEELERSRAQMLDEIRLGRSDPATVAALLARRLYWGDTPRGRIATPATLARIGRADLQAFHRRHVQPGGVTLVLAGDIEPAQALALVARHFGDWKARPAASAAALPVPPRPGKDTALLVDLPGAGQSAVLLLAPYAAQGNDMAQRQALADGAVANAVLGVGYSSRLNQQVRIRRGLSYGAASGAEALPGGGMLVASAQTKPQSAAEVARLLRAELLRLSAEPVPAAELAARQAVLVGDFERQFETTASLAATAAEQLLRGRALDELPGLPAALLAVDAARVRGFAAQHWPAEALRTVIVGDLTAAGAALRAGFPAARVLRANALDWDGAAPPTPHRHRPSAGR